MVLPDALEILWNSLLSRQPDLVREAFSGLNLVEQKAVLSHLHRMTEEDGWHREQRISASIALRELDDANTLSPDGSATV